LLVVNDTCPLALVWLLILAQTRESADRPTMAGATLAAGAFVLAEAGGEFVWAWREA
jgi:TRAP-type mannitol/chloroaromatic compound transport system permease large subunit